MSGMPPANVKVKQSLPNFMSIDSNISLKTLNHLSPLKVFTKSWHYDKILTIFLLSL